jgi:hypothetical protein
MWETLTTALCGLGFTAAITLLIIELPAVLTPTLTAHRSRH